MQSKEKAEFIIWVIEITAREFFNNDKTTAYNVLKDIGILNTYADTYDVTHTLSANYITDEIRNVLKSKGVIK